MVNININYDAKSIEEVLQLLAVGDGNVTVVMPESALNEEKDKKYKTTAVEIETKPEEVVTVEVESETEPEEVETIEEEKSYSIEDLQKLAVEVNKAGKLSQVKAFLEEHGIARITETPEEKRAELGALLEELVA